MLAQELFLTQETKKKQKRDSLIKRGMRMWSMRAEEYRILPIKYLFLSNLMKEKGVKVRSLTRSKLEDYPWIPFFRILGEAEALAWLESMETSRLERMLDEVEFILDSNYAYTTLRSWMVDAVYKMEHSRRPSLYSLIR